MNLVQDVRQMYGFTKVHGNPPKGIAEFAGGLCQTKHAFFLLFLASEFSKV